MTPVPPPQLAALLRAHAAWLENPAAGRQADLTGVTLNDTNLADAVLRRAILNGATLLDANLAGADLSSAAMENVDAERANFSGADLSAPSSPTPASPAPGCTTSC